MKLIAMHVITGIDFSRSSAALVKRAATCAARSGSPLTILHVVSEDVLARYLFSNPHRDREVVREDAEAQLKKFLGQIDFGNVATSSRVEFGNPSKVLCAEASPEGGDLLILSSHDTGHSQIGPTASRCVRKASADVLLVRDWHDGPYKKIVVCTDFSQASSRALSMVLQFFVSSVTESLEIVHVIYPPGKDIYGPVLDDFIGNNSDYREHAYHEAERRLNDFCRPFAEEIADVPHATRVLESTSPAHRITNHLRATDTDLVAVGTTGKGHFLGLMLGSNAERIIQMSPCSVLAVRSGD